MEAGKEPAFLFLVSFLAACGFIRTSAHMIRAQVSWWPGNVEVGGTHIHHLVWGIIMLMVSGWIAIAVDPGSPARDAAAIAFGIGTGLTLDEFALWLELKDVYWSEDGRKSIDAVIVAAILAGLGVLGLHGARRRRRRRRAGGARRGRVLRAGRDRASRRRQLREGKFGMAALGLLIPPVASSARCGWPSRTRVWARPYGEKKRGARRSASGRTQLPAAPPRRRRGAGRLGHRRPARGRRGASRRRLSARASSRGGRRALRDGRSPRRVWMTTAIEAATGIASSAPRMPRICAPASRTTIATSGFTLHRPAVEHRLHDPVLELLVDEERDDPDDQRVGEGVERRDDGDDEPADRQPDQRDRSNSRHQDRQRDRQVDAEDLEHAPGEQAGGDRQA